MRIKHKLTLGILIVSLLVWFVGCFAISKAQKLLQDSIILSSQQFANDILGKIDRNVYSRIEIFKEYSKDSLLQNTLHESNSFFSGIDNITHYLNRPDTGNEYLIQGKGDPANLSEEIKNKIAFYEKEYGYKLFTDVLVTNKYGITVAQNGKSADKLNDHKQWWQKARENGLYVDDIVQEDSTGNYSIIIGIRVDDKNGDFMGTIQAVLNVEVVRSTLKDLELHGLHKKHMTMVYELATQEGNIIYTTDISEETGMLLEKSIADLVFHDNPSHSRYYLMKNPGEKERLYIHAHSKGYRYFNGLEWTLIIGHETDEIFSPVTELRNRILLISLIITILTVLMGLLISRSIAKPLTKLKNAAVEIGRGNMDVSITGASDDEIGELSTAFMHMTEALQTATKDLKDKNNNLSILHKISLAMSQTIDIDELLSTILTTITEIDIINVERKGGIFILKDERMELVSHLGHTDNFLELHKDMQIGDCLCGLAAQTGEMVISKNCEGDKRHTIRPEEMVPHGHIIIPFHARGSVIGVIYLYVQADIHLDEETLTLLHSIANQIGFAVDNARLYKETKMDSLHDPLTGLANRRLMDIVFERSFTRAKRLQKPFSIIMLDIDYFKKYNDTYGHSAGDRILTKIASLIQKEIREIDLSVRYGGEEFVVMLPDTEMSEAVDVAERIRRTVQGKADVTISLGVSSLSHEMTKKEELINKADSLLYLAKNMGRNRVAANFLNIDQSVTGKSEN